MDLQLFSIQQMPRTVPLWDTILEDLGRPPLQRVAAALGVGRSSVYRWNASGRAPRAALLALFWLTRWGRSAVNAQAVNDALMAVQLARSYREECNKLRALGPDELAWPAIEPGIEPIPNECGETRALPGKEGCVSLLWVLRQAHPSSSAFPAPGPARVAAPVPAPCPSPPNEGVRQAVNTARHGASPTAPARPTAPANAGARSGKATKSAVARPGTPASASRAERPAQLGLAPQPPAPRAPAPSTHHPRKAR